MPKSEFFISVDVETSGSIPGEFSILEIGACAVDDDSLQFSCELRPINENFEVEALAAIGRTPDDFESSLRDGVKPVEALRRFRSWAEGLAGDRKLVFVGLNASFDWMFVNWYFIKFLGHNPFGFSALDIKAYYMGATGCIWDATRSSQMHKTLSPRSNPTHKGVGDAIYQAELFRLMRDIPKF